MILTRTPSYQRSSAVKVFSMQDISSQIYGRGSVAEMVKLSRVCTGMYDGLQDRIRYRLSKFLLFFCRDARLMKWMACETLSLFDLSSYAFLHMRGEHIVKLKTLYLVCDRYSEDRVSSFFATLGFDEDLSGNPLWLFRHLSLNPQTDNIKLFTKKGHFCRIALARSKTGSVVPAALGTVSTPFMNVVGPSTLWVAHGTNAILKRNILNPLHGPAPWDPEKAKRIKSSMQCVMLQARMACPGWRRPQRNLPHTEACSKDLRCPETIRLSTDDGCAFMYFGLDYATRAPELVYDRRSRGGGLVIWRLGGPCYPETVPLAPFVILIGEADERDPHYFYRQVTYDP